MNIDNTAVTRHLMEQWCGDELSQPDPHSHRKKRRKRRKRLELSRAGPAAYYVCTYTTTYYTQHRPLGDEVEGNVEGNL